MPHVLVKVWPGKSEAQKRLLADAIVTSVADILNCGGGAVSVAFEEVSADEWTQKVVEPDILSKWDTLTKTPGYIGASPNSRTEKHSR